MYSGDVKRKRIVPGGEPNVGPETVVPEAILEQAKRAIETDRMRKPVACTVCGAESASNSAEGLCWVCRRLKLSAWRDVDSQISAQE
jgi:hypothetical protein